jgi:LysM repeat protein
VAAADAAVAAPVALGESVVSVALSSAGMSSSILAPALKIFAATSVAGVLGWIGGSWQEQTIAKREAIHVAAAVTAKVGDLEARLADASRRAVAAEADVAELLAAVPARRPVQTTRAAVPVLRMPSTEARGEKYVVLRGNTLLQIARDTGITPEALRAANPVYDFTLMMVGDEINIPAPGVIPPPADRTSAEASPPKPAIPADAAYTVMAGDTVVKIAAKAGLTTDQIKSLNPETNWLRLRIGDQLRVR